MFFLFPTFILENESGEFSVRKKLSSQPSTDYIIHNVYT